jgi:hypothetical protein
VHDDDNFVRITTTATHVASSSTEVVSVVSGWETNSNNNGVTLLAYCVKFDYATPACCR